MFLSDMGAHFPLVLIKSLLLFCVCLVWTRMDFGSKLLMTDIWLGFSVGRRRWQFAGFTLCFHEITTSSAHDNILAGQIGRWQFFMDRRGISGPVRNDQLTNISKTIFCAEVHVWFSTTFFQDILNIFSYFIMKLHCPVWFGPIWIWILIRFCLRLFHECNFSFEISNFHIEHIYFLLLFLNYQIWRSRSVLAWSLGKALKHDIEEQTIHGNQFDMLLGKLLQNLVFQIQIFNLSIEKLWIHQFMWFVQQEIVNV